MTTSRAPADLETLLRHTGWLRALATGLIGDSHRAEDVVQETIVAALRRPPSRAVDADGQRAWLGRVARNFARLSLRGERRRAARERAAAPPGHVPSVADLVERFERQREIVEAVTNLEPRDREVILLRYFEDLPPREIARRLGVTSGVVRSRLSRARDVLRGHLDRAHGGDRAAWAVPLGQWLVEGPAPATPWLPILTGLLTMKQTSNVVVGVTAVVFVSLATLFWMQGRVAAVPSQPPATEQVGALSPTTDEPAATAENPDRRLVEPPATRGGEGTSGPAAVEPDSTLVVRARCVRPDTTPVAAVVLVVDGRDGVSAQSGPDGRIELSLPWSDIADEEGGPEALGLRFVGEREVEVRRALQPTAPGVVALGDVVLEPAGGLEGQVLGFHGTPRAGVEVTAVRAFVDVEPGMREEARNYGFWMALDNLQEWCSVTDATGRYRLAGVPTRFVSVRAKAADSYFSFSAPVAVQQGETTTVPDVRLERPAFDNLVQGQVLAPDGQPLSDVRVSLLEPSRTSSRPSRASTDDDGRFTLLVPAGVEFLAVARGGDRWNDAEAQVRGGDRRVTLQFEPTRWLAVSVHDRAGEQPSGARARAVWNAGGRWLPLRTLAPSATDKSGGIRLSIPDRVFHLEVRADGCGTKRIGPFDPGRVPEVVKVVLEHAGGLRGRVQVDGEPRAGAVVHVHVPWWAGYRGRHAAGFVSRLQERWRHTAKSGADGAFILTLEHSGTYLVHVELPGRARTEVGPVEFVAGRERDLGTIEPEPAGTLTGQVLVAAGVEVAGTVVGATNGDGHLHTIRVDDQGRYRLAGLAAGAYQVLAFPSKLDHRRFQIEREGAGDPVAWNARVEAGHETSCVIDNRDRGPIRFTIEVRLGGKPPLNWSAVIHGGPSSQLNGQLDAEGRWTGTLTRHGDYQVTCDGPFGALLQPSVSAPISCRPEAGAEVTWRFDVETGTVRLVDLPLPEPRAGQGLVARERMRLYWAGSEGRMWWLPLRSAVNGSLTIPDVPAGRLALRRRPDGSGGGSPHDWPVVIEFELAPGESKEISAQ